MVQTLKSRLIPWQVLKRLEDGDGVPVNGNGVAWAVVVERSEGVLKATNKQLAAAFSRLKTRSEAKDLVEQITRRVQEWNLSPSETRLLQVRAGACCCGDEFA